MDKQFIHELIDRLELMAVALATMETALVPSVVSSGELSLARQKVRSDLTPAFDELRKKADEFLDTMRGSIAKSVANG